MACSVSVSELSLGQLTTATIAVWLVPVSSTWAGIFVNIWNLLTFLSRYDNKLSSDPIRSHSKQTDIYYHLTGSFFRVCELHMGRTFVFFHLKMYIFLCLNYSSPWERDGEAYFSGTVSCSQQEGTLAGSCKSLQPSVCIRNYETRW